MVYVRNLVSRGSVILKSASDLDSLRAQTLKLNWLSERPKTQLLTNFLFKYYLYQLSYSKH